MPPKPAKETVLCVDIDGVICDNSKPETDYYERTPYPQAVIALRRLKEAGYYLRLQTARGMDRFGGDLQAIDTYHRSRLYAWLDSHGIPYDELSFGKVVACRYIDDLGFRLDSNEGSSGWDQLFRELGLSV